MMNEPRAPMVHYVKTWPEPFNALWRGDKRHEVRRNDRDYRVGDQLQACEWSQEHGYTGRVIQCRISYVTPGGAFGLPQDICVMSIEVTGRLGIGGSSVG